MQNTLHRIIAHSFLTLEPEYTPLKYPFSLPATLDIAVVTLKLRECLSV